MRLWRKRSSEASKTLWLIKDDPEGEWHCECPQGIVDAPHHDAQTYPTGGTGWLFTCVKCKKAFMFARAGRIRESLEQLATRGTPRVRRVYDRQMNLTERVLLATPKDWLEKAAPLAAPLEEGKRYVFFDGALFPAVPGPVRFKGLWRSHDLPNLPHIAGDPLSELLSSAAYWTEERKESVE